MAACLKLDDGEGQDGGKAGARVGFAPSATSECDASPRDEGAAPRQPLLHTFSTPVGGILLVSGLVMIVLPGPSVPLLVGGLALLSREYEWARRLLDVVAKRAPPGWRRFFSPPALEARAPVQPSDAS